jgi:hypothetical protein
MKTEEIEERRNVESQVNKGKIILYPGVFQFTSIQPAYSQLK